MEDQTTDVAAGMGLMGAGAATGERGEVVVPDLEVDGILASSESPAEDLEQAIQTFLAGAGTGVISVSRVVNPLLHVWSIARDADAAAPVESLLTVLVGRSLTTSDELKETMREVRAVLASAKPLARV